MCRLLGESEEMIEVMNTNQPEVTASKPDKLFQSFRMCKVLHEFEI